jgi:hypothetical protein
MQEGDELWTFCTPPETCEHLADFGGIALVRRGKMVAKIVTLLQQFPIAKFRSTIGMSVVAEHAHRPCPSQVTS